MRIKRILFPGLAALLLFTAGCSRNCLWKATSDRGTLYLQGSVHLLTKSDYPLNRAIEKAYEESDALVFETDMAVMLSATSQMLLQEKATLPEGRTLQGELDAETYSRLIQELSDAGMSAASVQQLKPWFATLTLMLLRTQSMGLDPNLGLDQYFHLRALADNKPEVGLESIEYQINLFDALSEGNQNEYVNHALIELEQTEALLDDLIGAWHAGDLDTLDALMRESFKDYPDMYEQFVTTRNHAWADKLDEMASRDTTYMVVVGAAHLGGESGLIELLREKGFTVEQL